MMIATAALLPACASSPDVQTSVDSQANMERFRTFVFLESPPKAAGAIADRQVRERLQRMVAARIAARGYVQVPPGKDAELGVHTAGQVTAKQRAFLVGRPGPYDYAWGRIELGGYDVVDYREGTLYVDIVELGKNQLLWRTRISEAFTASYSEGNWEKVERALDEAFKTLPARR
jgi:hypothetical protein